MKDSTAKLLALGVIGGAIWYYLRKRDGVGSLLAGSLDGLGAKMTKQQQDAIRIAKQQARLAKQKPRPQKKARAGRTVRLSDDSAANLWTAAAAAFPQQSIVAFAAGLGPESYADPVQQQQIPAYISKWLAVSLGKGGALKKLGGSGMIAIPPPPQGAQDVTVSVASVQQQQNQPPIPQLTDIASIQPTYETGLMPAAATGVTTGAKGVQAVPIASLDQAIKNAAKNFALNSTMVLSSTESAKAIPPGDTLSGRLQQAGAWNEIPAEGKKYILAFDAVVDKALPVLANPTGINESLTSSSMDTDGAKGQFKEYVKGNAFVGEGTTLLINLQDVIETAMGGSARKGAKPFSFDEGGEYGEYAAAMNKVLAAKHPKLVFDAIGSDIKEGYLTNKDSGISAGKRHSDGTMKFANALVEARRQLNATVDDALAMKAAVLEAFLHAPGDTPLGEAPGIMLARMLRPKDNLIDAVEMLKADIRAGKRVTYAGVTKAYADAINKELNLASRVIDVAASSASRLWSENYSDVASMFKALVISELLNKFPDAANILEKDIAEYAAAHYKTQGEQMRFRASELKNVMREMNDFYRSMPKEWRAEFLPKARKDMAALNKAYKDAVRGASSSKWRGPKAVKDITGKRPPQKKTGPAKYVSDNAPTAMPSLQKPAPATEPPGTALEKALISAGLYGSLDASDLFLLSSAPGIDDALRSRIGLNTMVRNLTWAKNNLPSIYYSDGVVSLLPYLASPGSSPAAIFAPFSGGTSAAPTIGGGSLSPSFQPGAAGTTTSPFAPFQPTWQTMPEETPMPGESNFPIPVLPTPSGIPQNWDAPSSALGPLAGLGLPPLSQKKPPLKIDLPELKP